MSHKTISKLTVKILDVLGLGSNAGKKGRKHRVGEVFIRKKA